MEGRKARREVGKVAKKIIEPVSESCGNIGNILFWAGHTDVLQLSQAEKSHFELLLWNSFSFPLGKLPRRWENQIFRGSVDIDLLIHHRRMEESTRRKMIDAVKMPSLLGSVDVSEITLNYDGYERTVFPTRKFQQILKYACAVGN